MGLMKISSVQQVMDGDKDYRMTTSPPMVTIYGPARMVFAVYALQLLALTAITDQAILDKIRSAADQITTPATEPWTQFDAQLILDAVGAPPAPSHVLVTRLPGQSIFLFRAAGLGTPKAKAFIYKDGTRRPAVNILPQVRAEGIVIPDKTCLEVPVKLVEDDQGLALAALLLQKTSRATTESKSSGKSN